MVRVSIQLKMALGLSVLILIALLWKIPESLQDESVWTDKIVHLLIFMILAISYLNVSTQGFKNFKFRNFGKNFDINNIIPYRFGNSFEVLYTSLLSTGIKAKLKGVFKNGGRLNFEAAYFNYGLRNKTPQLFEALNLPEISLKVYLVYFLQD